MPPRDCDFTLQVRWTITDDCSTSYAPITQTVHVEPRELPYSPLHLQQNVELNPFFKWAILSNSRRYRLLLRRNSDESSQQIALVQTNQFKLDEKSRLEQNRTYFWNIEYLDQNGVQIKTSPSYEFHTKTMCDLSLIEVKVPIDAFPAEDILGIQSNILIRLNQWSQNIFVYIFTIICESKSRFGEIIIIFNIDDI